MDDELKSFLLQILKNQAEIITKSERILANLESEYDEHSVKRLNNSYNEFAEAILTQISAERADIEIALNNEEEIDYKFN